MKFDDAMSVRAALYGLLQQVIVTSDRQTGTTRNHQMIHLLHILYLILLVITYNRSQRYRVVYAFKRMNHALERAASPILGAVPYFVAQHVNA
jgi:hypothetical protein